MAHPLSAAKRAIVASLLLAAPLSAATPVEQARWSAHAAATTITRDDWGIAHVHGHSDADAVFGMAYAQAEDDFNRVETNYINAMGRLAETQGESAIWQDLRMKLFVTPGALKADYARSPSWLQALMIAWADGLNAYLARHPDVKPRVIAHFEPWMALSFSEGSIGGDIERVSLSKLEAFYGQHEVALADDETPGRFIEPRGSNGIAIAPGNTRDGHALLLINPHTSFFFRSELQMTSDAGLNAYGAVTWGQFFIYQGFNQNAGWMHTTSGVDSVDEFAETTVRKGGRLFYRHAGKDVALVVESIAIPYRAPDGTMASRSFRVYRTLHGPIVRAENGRWISVALMNTPVAALEQSFLRTKASDFAGFLKVAALQANSSNNTLFADTRGEVALLMPQFVPRRADRFDYTRPVDGSDAAADWQGLTPLAALPTLSNPTSGWLANSNDAPWSAAGPGSLNKSAFPRYMDTAGANPRSLHYTRVLSGVKDFTPETLMAAAYDSYLPAFARLVPGLVAAWERAPAGDAMKVRLADQVASLKAWDYRWSAASQPTALAVFWGEAMWARVGKDADDDRIKVYDYIADRTSDAQKLAALAEASDRLAADFGTWRTPWGEINRFQRLTGDLVQPFDDSKPSLAVPFTSAQWGSLASFGAKRWPGTKRYYGTLGNSFVAVVEFGPQVRAFAVTAGGESGHPASPHFNDQALRYASGDLRPVYFYPEDLKGHTERRYRPGD